MDVKVSGVSYMTEHRKRGWNLSSLFKPEVERVLHLRDASLTLRPGSVSAIIGCGSGYKKLLECIALRQNEGFMSGSIHYDNSVRQSGAFRDIVFVADTGGSHFDSLTVFDYLFFAARLRISQGKIECRERARVATKLVGLDGSSRIQTLNATDLRLLTIAGELVGMPTLICISSPLEGLDAAGAIDVMHALYKVAKRQSTPTTVVYCVDGLNNDMLRYVDNVFIFNKTAQLQSIPIQLVDNVVKHQVENLITDMSLHIIEYNEAEAAFIMKRKTASAIEQMTQVDEEFSDEALSTTINKLSLDLADLLCSTRENGGSQGSIVIGNVNSLPTNENLARTLSPISYGGVAHYNDADDNYLALGRPNSVADRTLTDNEGWSSLAVSPMHNGGRWQKVAKEEDGADDGIPTEPKNQFKSNAKRRGDMGVSLRPMKPVWNEISILVLRSFKYHWKNVSFLIFVKSTPGSECVRFVLQRTLFRMSLFRYMFAGVIVGTLAYNDGSYAKINDVNLIANPDTMVENSSAYNVASALFIMVAMSVIGCAFAVPYLHGNVSILKLEVAAGLHRTLSSWISIVAVELPAFVLAAFCLSGLLHALINLTTPVQTFYGAAVLVILVGYSLALSCSAWCKSANRATFWFGVWSMICIIFSGYLQTIPNLPGMWPWACTVSFTRWSFEALMVSVFHGVSGGDEFLSTMYDFSDDSTTPYILWELVWLLGLQLVVVVGLMPPARNLQIIEFDSFHIRNFDVSELLEDESMNGQGQSVKPLKGPLLALSGDDPSLSKDKVSKSTAIDADMESASASNTVTSVAVRDCADRFTVVPIKSAQQAHLSFQRLKYELRTKGSNTQDFIIQNISGSVEPGNSLCVLDGQAYGGAGITLLQILAGRAPHTGKVTGTIRVNGQKLKRGMSYINAAYVEAGDICLTPITVKECIKYAAMLRRTDQKTCPQLSLCLRGCGKSVIDCFCSLCRGGQQNGNEDYYRSLDAFDLIGMTGDVAERVEEIIKMMGLEDCANTIIANTSSNRFQASMCNLSPAQLRCLTIAVELVNRPGLIFLEDPVQGLNWCDADVVATAVQCLTQGGRSIIATLQTPSYRVHRTFSDTLLIGSGLMLYFGSTPKAVTYFENIGFERTQDQNPLQYIMKIGGDMGVMKKQPGSGRRSATLSPEDLADLCRSLNKITSASPPKQSGNGNHSRVIGSDGSFVNTTNGAEPEDDIDDDYDTSSHNSSYAHQQQPVVEASLLDKARGSTNPTNSSFKPGANKRKASTSKRSAAGVTEKSNIITTKKIHLSVGPITRVLTTRGYHYVFRDVSLLFLQS
jgi:ABC-type multidrug transport system ATPase subunit